MGSCSSSNELCVRNNSKKSLEKSIFLLFAPVPGFFGERLFDLYDKDNDGYIDLNQFLNILEKFSKCLDLDISSEIFEICDLKTDGVVDKEEFLQTFYSVIKENLLKSKTSFIEREIFLNPPGQSKAENMTQTLSMVNSINEIYFKNKATVQEVVDSIFEKYSKNSSFNKSDFSLFLSSHSWLVSKLKESLKIHSWTNALQNLIKCPKKTAASAQKIFLFPSKIFSNFEWKKVFIYIKDLFLMILSKKKRLKEVFFIDGCKFKAIDSSLHLTYYSQYEKRISFEFESKETCLEVKSVLVQSANTRRFKNFYRLEEKIGSGKFSTVYVCSEVSSDAKWGVKIVKKQKMDRTEREFMKNEINIMKNCSMKGVIQIKDVFESNKEMKIVMELVRGGDLLKKISEDTSDEREIKDVVRKILIILKDLHGIGIIHRDIKPENILLCEENGGLGLKIIDFGLATYLKPLETKKYKCGTLVYMAPEVVNGNYDKKADVWSVGIIAYAYLMGKLPFYSESKDEVLHLVKNEEPDFESEKWKKYSIEAMNFTKALLMKNPENRPSCEEALNHDWFLRSCSSLV